MNVPESPVIWTPVTVLIDRRRYALMRSFFRGFHFCSRFGGGLFSGLLLMGGGSAAEPVDPAAVARAAQRADERAADREMDRAWERFQKHEPNLGVRDLYNFVLNAAQRNWRPEVLSQVIELAGSMQDRDPQSQTYGNYRWYWHDPKPDDRNAVEFSMQTVSLTWRLYRDRFTPESREKLATAITLGGEGMLHHKVDVSYTNIFLMRLANCILLGEATDRPDWVQQGARWFDEWFAYTRANGVHEFASPTYYGVDLTDLGALALHARDPKIRTQAETALRFFWTEIAARWFEPYQGIAGAYSRDYGFLTGHGDLDQHLQRAGWNHLVPTNPRPALEDLTQWNPPADLRAGLGAAPRNLYQRWGKQPWEQATTYVGNHFVLGTAGAGYCPQDKMLALTLTGGPQRPIVNFAMDSRDDPYGQAKVVTGGGHLKLTHLVPFTTSVQRGPEALMLAAFDPGAKGGPAAYASVYSNVVLPLDVELWSAEGKFAVDAATPSLTLPADHLLFLRDGDTAVALAVVYARDDRGQTPTIQLLRDGFKYHAQRLAVINATGKPAMPVATAIWMRAAENLDDTTFASFRRDFSAAAAKVSAVEKGDRLALSVPSLVRDVELKLVANLRTKERIMIEGFDPALQNGVLNLNGRDLGAELLK